MSEQWLSIIEYSRTFSISDMTVRRRIKNGRIKANLIDGKYYIPVDSNQFKDIDDRQKPQHTVNQGPVKAFMEFHGKPSNHDEMTIVKGANSSPAFYQRHLSNSNLTESKINAGRNLSRIEDHHSSNWSPSSIGTIPQEISDGVNRNSTLLVESKALLSFCEKYLQQCLINDRNQKEKYESKIIALENEIKKKDLELKNCQQQIEDLQVLIKIFEKKDATQKK
ncbi:MAG: hypothetical protein HQK54_00455 [Oligoflexales bacterium]|nr:hypothetical protein [Oligoflexales bacterium]